MQDHNSLPYLNPKEVSELVSAAVSFGMDMFSSIISQNIDQNVFISPLSIDLALLMAYNGAGSDTKLAMEKAMKLVELDLELLNSQCAKLMEFLEKADPSLKLSIANSLWTREGIQFNDEFVDVAKEAFRGEVKSLDFNDSGSLSVINNWAAEKTGGKITRVINEIARDAIAFILNAIYFKGEWTDKFDKDLTKDRTFTCLDGSQKEHPMMSLEGEFSVFEDENLQAIILSYGYGYTSMVVYLPSENHGLEGFYRNLSGGKLAQIKNSFQRKEGNIVLPRFKLEYGVSLEEILSVLGMGVAFDRRNADFKKIANIDENIFLDSILHKTFVEVNEEGTEAAAVTAIAIGALCEPEPLPHFEMIVDRPFFFTIQDNTTGALLFMGSIVDPDE